MKQHWPGMYQPKLIINDELESNFKKTWIPSQTPGCSPVCVRTTQKIKLDNNRAYGVVCATPEEVRFIIRQKRAYRDLIDQLVELNQGWRPTFARNEVRGFFLFDHAKKEALTKAEKGTGQKLPACEYFRSDISIIKILKTIDTKIIQLAKWGIEDWKK